jgi:FkbM family methyltransferase
MSRGCIGARQACRWLNQLEPQTLEGGHRNDVVAAPTGDPVHACNRAQYQQDRGRLGADRAGVLTQFLSAFRIDCVFDVGANIGQYGKRLRQIGYRGLIISFEPNPNAFQKLQEAAKADRQWIVRQTALDSEIRNIVFNVMKSDQFSSLHVPDNTTTTIFRDMNVIETQIPVTTATLNDLFPGLRAQFGFSRPFLKMDTQGHDFQVVAGADKYLMDFVGLQSELGLTPLYEDSLGFSEALALYRSKGFKLSALVPNNKGHFPDLHEIDCIMYNPAFM